MQKFQRTFNDVPVRMFKTGRTIYYCAYDVVTALGIEDTRRAVNMAVIKGQGSFLNSVEWEGEKVLFFNDDLVISLVWDAEWDLGKMFVKWLLEVRDISRYMQPSETDKRLTSVEDYFSTTQIAKKYGISASKLNEILHTNGVQYRVNEQWVLYSKYQDLDYTRSLKFRKKNSEEGFIFHTYWTSKGVRFIQGVLDRLGYRPQGEQLQLF